MLGTNVKYKLKEMRKKASQIVDRNKGKKWFGEGDQSDKGLDAL